jgi:hypothetical protein
MKYILFIVVLFYTGLTNTQQKDIPVSKLPAEVKSVLDEYISILTSSNDLEECADKFLLVAGGTLVTPEGNALRNSVKPYSLKKDFENIKYYKVPVKITRAAKTTSQQCGYGESAIAGDWYKIYIEKKDGTQPAPVQIIVPKNHPQIKTPKVISIGSL